MLARYDLLRPLQYTIIQHTVTKAWGRTQVLRVF